MEANPSVGYFDPIKGLSTNQCLVIAVEAIKAIKSMPFRELLEFEHNHHGLIQACSVANSNAKYEDS